MIANFGLTKKGEAICLNEYAAHISEFNSTQVILIEDWQAESNLYPDDAAYISPLTEFQELVLPSRPGRSRLHYLSGSSISAIYSLFEVAKNQQERRTFQVPSFISDYT